MNTLKKYVLMNLVDIILDIMFSYLLFQVITFEITKFTVNAKYVPLVIFIT